MVSKISRICQRFKETLGVRITRKLGDLDLDARTSFVTTSQLAASAEENITREGRGMSPSEKQIADIISTIREESSISLTRTTTWNLPGPSGTRDCIDIVYLSHPSPLLCGG